MTIPPPLYFDLFLWWVCFALVWRDPLYVAPVSTGYHWKDLNKTERII